MTRINRKDQGWNRTTISVTLPAECMIAINKFQAQTGNNRSLAIEYIILDWKRTMQAQKEARQ